MLDIIKELSRRSDISQYQMIDPIHIDKKPILADAKSRSRQYMGAYRHRHIHLNDSITSRERTGRFLRCRNHLSIMDTGRKRHITATHGNLGLRKPGIKLTAADHIIKSERPRSIPAKLKTTHLHLRKRSGAVRSRCILRQNKRHLLTCESFVIEKPLSNNLIITAIRRSNHKNRDITRTIRNKTIKFLFHNTVLL